MFTRVRQGGENHSLRGERRKRCQKDVFMRERLRRSFPVEGNSKKFLGTKVLALKLTVHVRHQLSAQLRVYLYFTERSLTEGIKKPEASGRAGRFERSARPVFLRVPGTGERDGKVVRVGPSKFLWPQEKLPR